MSPTLAMRPMHHPPAFETIPELAPVLEYQHYTSSGGGANTTSNCNSSVSFFASASSLHSRNTVRKHSSAVPTTVAARSQLPPLDTALPLAYPMYPGLQTASNTTTTTITGMSNNTTTAITAAGSTAPPTTTIMSRRGQEPRSLNRPRKISTSYSRRDSSSSSPRCPSYETSQQYRIQYQSPTSSSPPLSILPRPPQQQQQNKKKPPPSEQPNALFGTLPGEVLQVVLEWLQSVHLDSSTSTSCATCWARDLCSLCLASRKWSEVARLALYQDIRIVGDDSAAHRKRFKLAQGCRMTLLRRTLRANSRLAAAVRSLQLPMPVGDSCDATPSSSSSRVAAGGLSPKQVYENRVASLVMACPNLEVLVGPGATHDHDTFNRITHALSTRTNLKTMNWRIGASSGSGNDLIARPASASHRESSSIFSSTLACMLPPPPPPLNAAQETSFLGHHRQWHSLASLSVHCLPGASLAPDTLLQRALTCLPSLQHLHLSRVPGNAFGDAALLSLPALRSLTLAHLPGVTAGGLSAFATRPNSQPLRSLQLRHTPLTSLPALARLLSHLPSLVSFALVQEFAPLMPTADDDGDAFALWMMPYLASRTLVRLHWDIVARHHHAHHHHHHRVQPAVSDADDILARSIEAGGFPALRTLRAPSDPDGIFQQLCRPREVIATSADRIWANGGRCGSSHSRHRTGSLSSNNSSSSSSSSSMGRHAVPSLPKSATAASLPTGGPFAAAPPATHGADLRAARMAAQARLDDARPRFRFQVQVHSDEGQLVDDFGLGGYVGTVGSPIHYSLDPDWGSSDARGGLVDVSDLTDPGGGGGGDDEEEGDGGYGNSGGISGCTGSWNWREGVVADKREKEIWWHTERARWVRPRLD